MVFIKSKQDLFGFGFSHQARTFQEKLTNSKFGLSIDQMYFSKSSKLCEFISFKQNWDKTHAMCVEGGNADEGKLHKVSALLVCSECSLSALWVCFACALGGLCIIVH